MPLEVLQTLELEIPHILFLMFVSALSNQMPYNYGMIACRLNSDLFQQSFLLQKKTTNHALRCHCRPTGIIMPLPISLSVSLLLFYRHARVRSLVGNPFHGTPIVALHITGFPKSLSASTVNTFQVRL